MWWVDTILTLLFLASFFSAGGYIMYLILRWLFKL
jgi:hypothetical protein